MLIGGPAAQSGASVTGAIQTAAQATGTSFQYLLATARVESGLDPHASARTSSARGLFQFVDRTWLATVKQAGASLGYGAYANAITRDANGQYQVSDPGMRQRILALRDNPTANAAMAGAFTRANSIQLFNNLGRPPSNAELYMAHFLGAKGASQLITLTANTPNASAASAFPRAAAANRPIFYDHAGNARSVADVYNLLAGRYDVAQAAATGDVASAAQPSAPVSVGAPLSLAAAAATPIAPAANTSTPVVAANAASTATAAPRSLFSGLFSSGTRQAPVSDVVRELWSTNPRVAAALTGSVVPQASAQSAQAVTPVGASQGLGNLYGDLPPNVSALFTPHS